MVLADSCRGPYLATPSSSVYYHKCFPDRACQEGRNFAPVLAIWHAGIVVDCPYGRTMFEFILVLSSYFAVVFVSVTGVTCSCAASGSVHLLSSVIFDPLDS